MRTASALCTLGALISPLTLRERLELLPGPLRLCMQKALCVHVYVRVYVCVMCLKASGRGGLEISIDLVPYWLGAFRSLLAIDLWDALKKKWAYRGAIHALLLHCVRLLITSFTSLLLALLLRSLLSCDAELAISRSDSSSCFTVSGCSNTASGKEVKLVVNK